MFTGSSNSEMLKFFMLTKGKISGKLVRRSAFADLYFNEKGLFLEQAKDGTTRAVSIPQQASSIVWKRLTEEMPEITSSSDRMWLLRFKDLLEKTLALDPSKRITAAEALAHPFFSD